MASIDAIEKTEQNRKKNKGFEVAEPKTYVGFVVVMIHRFRFRSFLGFMLDYFWIR